MDLICQSTNVNGVRGPYGLILDLVSSRLGIVRDALVSFVSCDNRIKREGWIEKKRSVNLDVRWRELDTETKLLGGQSMKFNRDGFPVNSCGCRVRSVHNVCKHYYANERSRLTAVASGTTVGERSTVSRGDPGVVQPGVPQPAPTFFHFPSVDGAPARLVHPDVRGETWDHTVYLLDEYRWYLRQWRRNRRRNP